MQRRWLSGRGCQNRNILYMVWRYVSSRSRFGPANGSNTRGVQPGVELLDAYPNVTAPFDATMIVKIDGTAIQTFTEPATAESAYTLRSIALPAAAANGASHVIRFEYNSPAGSGNSGFFIDDVSLDTACSRSDADADADTYTDPNTYPTPTPTPTPTPGPTLVTVSGKVLTPDGRGLRSATVTMTDPQNVVRSATTSSFGFFSFDNVTTGGTFIFRVQSRSFRYSPQSVLITAATTLPDFLGLE